MYPDRVKVINGNQTLEEVVRDCTNEVLKYLGVK